MKNIEKKPIISIGYLNKVPTFAPDLRDKR
ncbi:hypothetical protein FLAT13_04506 [Flavobacterium salmonis]|uniref:Uncharacterized protein n=1 Tax=Flavobacterium salmonis TaxID=2654844 RepID=A0A6V6ZBA2_9FLAO|nr:hypothetical protein FLAT13_04506 [Flavobacterium salmonis]